MKINEKFLINLQGKSYVTYEGLLDLAHQKDLKSLEVEIIQFPKEENNMTAICSARATTDQEVYVDIGDASPRSVNANIVPHLIRMASTRAKARVLRDLTNIGMTAIEELASIESLAETEERYSPNMEEPPTKRQLETIRKLAEDLNRNINYSGLNKKTAGNLISQMLDEIKKA